MFMLIKIALICYFVFPEIVSESGQFTGYSFLALYLYIEFNRLRFKSFEFKYWKIMRDNKIVMDDAVSAATELTNQIKAKMRR
tara:strand:- start:570 stop:818 length:249 start_codon:yes stop_codon:yes gene_type:complete